MPNERRAEGQAKAKEAGKHMGRSKALTADEIKELKQRVAAGVSKTTLATEYGVSRATIYASLK